MRIEGSEFGNITIDGKTYDHDVIIGLSGNVKKRQKKLSKKQYGTSHIISRVEAKSVFEKGCDLIIIGAGHEGNVHLSPEARDLFREQEMRCDIAANTGSHSVIQPFEGEQDRPDARNLLMRCPDGGLPRRRPLTRQQLDCQRLKVSRKAWQRFGEGQGARCAPSVRHTESRTTAPWLSGLKSRSLSRMPKS
jgi:hypothetical protein